MSDPLENDDDLVQLEEVDESGESRTEYQYDQQNGHNSMRGNRSAITSYTPNVAAEIDSKNGWHEPADTREPNADSLAENMAAANSIMAWIYEGRQLHKATGMGEAVSRFMVLLRGRGYEVNNDYPYALPPHLQFSDQLLRYVDKLLDYCTADGKINVSTSKGLLRAFVRYLAMTWMVRPEFLLGDHPSKVLSLDELTKPLGLSRCWLSMVAEQFGKDFGIQSRNQKRLSTRVNYAKATKAAWAKRKKEKA